MQRHRTFDSGGPSHAGQRSARHQRQVGIGAHRPFGEDNEDEGGSESDRSGSGTCKPRHEQGGGHENGENDEGRVGVRTHEHKHGSAEQIGRERPRRDRLNVSFVRSRPEHETAHHQQGCERESGKDVKRIRPHHRRIEFQDGQGPEQREGDGADREPAPQSDPRQAEGRRGDDREVDIERPEIGPFRRNEDRGGESADDAETGQHRPMQQSRGKGAECDQTEQEEGGRWRQKVVQRISGIDGCKGDRSPGRGEDRRNIGDRQDLDGGGVLAPPRRFARGKQGKRKQPAEHDAHARPKQPGIDGVADEEEAAERQGRAAEPDHPTGANALLEAGQCRRGGRGCGGRFVRRPGVCPANSGGWFARHFRLPGWCTGRRGGKRLLELVTRGE